MNKHFENIIGYDGVKEELDLICDALLNSNKYKELGVYTPRGLMLHGAPGLGKTTMARALIKASGRKTYILRKTESDGSFVRKISKVFEEARNNAPSIVFLDDMDKFSDCDDNRRNNTDEYIAVQSAIDDSLNYEVFVLATANDIDDIPNSLLRTGRFDKVIQIKYPNVKDARKIVDYYLKKKKKVINVNSELIAKIIQGHSCSDLETVVNEAGLTAAYNNKDVIENDDIIKACLRVIYNAPKDETIDYKQKKLAAVHECGHAIVSEIMYPGSVNLVSVSNHATNAAGLTSCNNDELYDTGDYRKQITVLLAGKAASEVIINSYDSGCNSDIRRARHYADLIIDNFAEYGFSLFERNFPSILSNRKDVAISLILDECYQEAKTILFNNKHIVKNMAKKLIEKSYLINDDIKAIMCEN